MIDLHGQAGLPYVNKSIYTGSFQGMRYRLRKLEETEEKLLEVVIYPEPYSFEATPADQKTTQTFPFTEEGFEAGIAWLNAMYKEQNARWEQARRAPWV